MNKIILILFFLSLHFLVLSQENDSIYLWQGFKHEWTYNHRINRIGNFLSEDKKEIIYTSASGLGADSTYYTSKYNLITDSGINPYYGKTRFEIFYDRLPRFATNLRKWGEAGILTLKKSPNMNYKGIK